ncbi:MAG: ABC transporter ATP-binding protein [Candidatus Asgardarchaeia archaeon]
MREIAVKASNLYKKFGRIVAVKGIDLQVKVGEIFGFLGPNGAGKTTTIRILTGILKPDSGKAMIMGYDIMDESVKAKKLMGVVPEEANPYPDLSSWDNLMLVGMLYGMPKNLRKERASQLLKNLGLYEMKDRKAKFLSKGMKQRLVVAMALIGEPKVLFLDEPTSGLDVLSSRKIRNLMMELKEEGVTIFMTTHNVEEAGSICDRIAIINEGRIISEGSPCELKIKSGKYTYVSAVFNRTINEGELSSFLGGVECIVKGNKIVIVCNKPGDVIRNIVKYAERSGLAICSLQTSQPSLEDVFVRLIRGERLGM